MESVFRMVVFRVGEEYFGMEISGVRGIVTGAKEVRTAGGHAAGERMLRVGEEVVPVMDLYEKLQIKPFSVRGNAYYLLFSYQTKLVAFPIDMPEKYYDVPAQNLSPVPVFLKDFRERYYQQIVRLDGRLVFVLNPERLFL